tara:strand:- start:5777 stop:6631 length:855 start_codon:yes stop_codon:yes gene_type:complete
MRIVLLANDSVAYSGILSYPIIKKFSKDIVGIFVQDGMLDSKNNSFEIFKKVKKKSGLKYAFSLAMETLNYQYAIRIRNFFHMNKHENNDYLNLNSKLGEEFKIPVFPVEGSINDHSWVEKIRGLKPDLIICIRYAEILKKDVLDIAPDGIINFHPSLLPKYKGLGPIFQAILHDEKEVGFSFHYIDEKIDTGNIIKMKKIRMNGDDSVSRLTIRAHVLGGQELVSIITDLNNGKKIMEKTVDDDTSYFSWPEKEDVKKFFASKKKYVLVRDFFSLVFFNSKEI